MGALILFLLLTLILFGVGFAAKALWWVALAFVVVWILGLVAHGPDRRWYYW
ncbi:MAG: hydrophobic protein [Actinomycetota bacterium]|nr:hydrophobic protein [Actinomycetota bacterium]